MHCTSCWVSVDVHSTAARSCCQHGQAGVHSHPRRDGCHQLVAQLRQQLALVVEHVHLRISRSRACTLDGQQAMHRGQALQVGMHGTMQEHKCWKSRDSAVSERTSRGRQCRITRAAVKGHQHRRAASFGKVLWQSNAPCGPCCRR